MKRSIWALAIICSFVTSAANAQVTEVESSLAGVQTGFLGMWVYYEHGLTREIVLRGEVGFDAAITGGSGQSTRAELYTVLSLELRRYYNLSSRFDKGKNVGGNSGNYLSLSTSFYPGWVTYIGDEGSDIRTQISLAPIWGLRRQVRRHFDIEAGIGAGIRYSWEHVNGLFMYSTAFIPVLHLRVGYGF